jgi:lysophospholipase L1-like esterase
MQFDEAMSEIMALQSAHPDDFRYVWLEGIALSLRGQHDAGRDKLETAFESLPFPDRCKASYRTVIARTAARLDAPYIDANALFAHDAGARLPLSYYLDWCHPTPPGHALIAEAIEKAIRNRDSALNVAR